LRKKKERLVAKGPKRESTKLKIEKKRAILKQRKRRTIKGGVRMFPSGELLKGGRKATPKA